MFHVVTDLDTPDEFEPRAEPTDAELAVIEQEMPLIRAEVDLLDAEIAVLDRVPSELDGQRWRRAVHRVLAARTALADRGGRMGGVA